MLSRSPLWTALTVAVFGFLAWASRPRDGEGHVPVLLAITAVTLSTMHQSSLGSLYLLMPNELDPAWWSPILPILFFLSAITAGLAAIVLVAMWVQKSWGRKLSMVELATVGRFTFWALLVYAAARIGDLVARGELVSGLGGPKSALLVAELGLGLLVPLVLLGVRSLREDARTLFLGALLACGGVVLNRTNVVYFAFDAQGPIPGVELQPYSPSVYEWGLSIGLIAATIFGYSLAVRHLPILRKVDPAAQH